MTQAIPGTPPLTPQPAPLRPKFSWAAVGLLSMNGLSALALLALAAVLGIVGIYDQFFPSETSGQTANSLSLAFYMGVIGILLLPGAIFALMRILGKPLPGPVQRTFKMLETIGLFSVPLWLLALLVGQWVAGNPQISWMVLPPLQILTGGIPVAWLVLIGQRGLSSGSPQRSWAVLSIELVATFSIILMAELVFFAGLVVVAVIWLASNPDVMQEFNNLMLRLSNMQQADTAAIQRILQPYLDQPVVSFILLAVISGFVPLIEELLKPLTVWVLAGRLTTPAQGFVAGLISGGGFALVESLGRLSPTSGDQWASIAIGRAGTDLLHVLTAGLMGWALVGAWRNGKILQLGLTYFLCVITHGLWNALALWMGITPVLPITPGEIPFSQSLGIFAPAGLLVLAVVMLFVLLRANRVLRASSQPTSIQEK
jgi:hypothetical protein